MQAGLINYLSQGRPKMGGVHATLKEDKARNNCINKQYHSLSLFSLSLCVTRSSILSLFEKRPYCFYLNNIVYNVPSGQTIVGEVGAMISACITSYWYKVNTIHSVQYCLYTYIIHVFYTYWYQISEHVMHIQQSNFWIFESSKLKDETPRCTYVSQYVYKVHIFTM